jgi:hypothetical protein
MRVLKMSFIALFAGASFVVGAGSVTSTASANECQLEGKPSLHTDVESCKPKLNEEPPTPTPPPVVTPPKPKPPVKPKPKPKPTPVKEKPKPKPPVTRTPPKAYNPPPVVSTPDAPVTRDAVPPAKFTGKAKCAWLVTIKNKGGETGTVTVRKDTKTIQPGKTATWVIPGKVSKAVAKGSEGFKKTFVNPCTCAPVAPAATTAPVTSDATPDNADLLSADVVSDSGYGTSHLLGAGVLGVLLASIAGSVLRRRRGSNDNDNSSTSEEALAS